MTNDKEAAVSKPRLITAVSVALFLRWLAVGHVTATVAGASVTVPALVVAATAVIAAAAALVAVAAFRVRAARIAFAPALSPDSRPEGGN